MLSDTSTEFSLTQGHNRVEIWTKFFKLSIIYKTSLMIITPSRVTKVGHQVKNELTIQTMVF